MYMTMYQNPLINLFQVVFRDPETRKWLQDLGKSIMAGILQKSERVGLQKNFLLTIIVINVNGDSSDCLDNNCL